ncbi:MAG: hypothetical protein ABR568_23500 [Pyrinomonadaceae bacterium]
MIHTDTPVMIYTQGMFAWCEHLGVRDLQTGGLVRRTEVPTKIVAMPVLSLISRQLVVQKT